MTNLLVALPVPMLWTTLATADVSGVWRLDFDPDFSGHHGSGECIFKSADKKLTGYCGTDSPNPTPLRGEVDEPSRCRPGACDCQRDVEAHGGHIWAESVSGKGSTISFTLRACCPQPDRKA